MNSITIRKISIIDLSADAVVNAANEDMLAGGGVCGAIFEAAGYDRLQAACSAIGHCDTGSAVITPGFGLKAEYIIHAVGPVWTGDDREKLLYKAYRSSLELAAANGCRSIGFPLISAGIYGYPKEKAWREAIRACRDFPDAGMRIIFAVLDDGTMAMGRRILEDHL